MIQRWIFILMFFALGALPLEAQTALPWTPPSIFVEKKIEQVTREGLHRFFPTYKKYGSSSQINSRVPLQKDPLGVFCTLDLKMDQKLPFKMRFRLGEYHYTHGLEYGR